MLYYLDTIKEDYDRDPPYSIYLNNFPFPPCIAFHVIENSIHPSYLTTGAEQQIRGGDPIAPVSHLLSILYKIFGLKKNMASEPSREERHMY